MESADRDGFFFSRYVRMNRKRLRGETGVEDQLAALETLCHVLMLLIRLMAPFTPFITDLMYQNLRRILEVVDPPASIHYWMLPEPDSSLRNSLIERRVARMQAVVELGRLLRDKIAVPIKFPLLEVVVVHPDQDYLDDVQTLQEYIKSELNVRSLAVSNDKQKWNVEVSVQPDFNALSQRLKEDPEFKKDFKEIRNGIQKLTDAQIQQMLATGEIVVEGHVIAKEQLIILHKVNKKSSSAAAGNYEAESNMDLVVLLNTEKSDELQQEGLARELINRIQRLRKKANLVPTDDVTIYCDVLQPGPVSDARNSLAEFVESAIKLPLSSGHLPSDAVVIIEETADVKGTPVKLAIVDRRNPNAVRSAPALQERDKHADAKRPTKTNATKQPAAFGNGPFSAFINVVPVFSANASPTTVMLPNPSDTKMMTYSNMLTYVRQCSQ